MSEPLVLDSHGFTRFIENLSKLSGKDFKTVLVDQTAALLKICVRRTRAASAAGIVKRVSRHNSHIEFEDGHVISDWKKADHAEMFLDDSNFRPAKNAKPPRLIKGKSWHQMNGGRRWSNERWARFQAFSALAKTKRLDPGAAKRSRGVSKASWLQIAHDLGINLDVPGYVRTAVPSNGKTYKNGVARQMLEGAAFFIEVSNSNPIVVGKLDGAVILQGALDTRLKAFAHEMKRGVFDDLAYRAKRYPGLFTK